MKSVRICLEINKTKSPSENHDNTDSGVHFRYITCNEFFACKEKLDEHGQAKHADVMASYVILAERP